MNRPIYVYGEALMDCVVEPDGRLRPVRGGSPYNLARAAARLGARVHFLCPFSRDRFGQQLKAALAADGAAALSPDSTLPTALAVVHLHDGRAEYAFYREGVADRDVNAAQLAALLHAREPGILHSGSLALMPPDHQRTLELLRQLRQAGWTISLDLNLRPQVAQDLQAYRAAVAQALTVADWIKASDEDLVAMGCSADAHDPERTFEPLLRHGARHVAVTFGAAGACLWVDGSLAQAPAPPVTVRDTVGAGDTFWGACLADWASGDQPAQRITQTLSRALVAAALNCERTGCDPPWQQEVEARLRM
ncbi:PfkB family carbohydrate kinase [Tepidimonas taiwanensis]|mgnify:CR=1 FL=1|uniref:Fructokinase n=1 Tax=Tepidimonas taiwanensis TaxID=307486 RepID=A0A554XA13_9BURK|nr:PfkB family carbohydrate kinase [Tepidimonas taiwanensis]MDM7464032.1 PfkB family carbohydrate kinase [Tepidimonas taiwanensis]TSE32661.1 Fructokinase [Tepidimonas taiwanensis]UBQ05402.1 PfkB family carbohydrate kinase [Tepidimonas taiwanensis]